MRLYMAVTRDRYELPYAVEQTVTDLARKIGVKRDTVYSAISLGRKGYVVVDVDVDPSETIEQRRCLGCGAELGAETDTRVRLCKVCDRERERARREASRRVKEA